MSALFPLLFRVRRTFTRALATHVPPQPSVPPKHTVSPLVRIVDGLFKTYKPVTPSIRHLRRPLAPFLYPGSPLRALTRPHRSTGGRNANGRITARARGGGHKRRLRVVDFMRTSPGVHDVVRIERDPGRSAHIALLRARDPDVRQPWSYILAPDGLRAGHTVQSFRSGIPDGFIPGYADIGRGAKLESSGSPQIDVAPSSVPSSFPGTIENNVAEPPPLRPGTEMSMANLVLGQLRTLTLKTGNVLPLRLIPRGTQIHALALHPDKRMILLRSAGSYGIVVAHEENGRYSQVRMQSGEVRRVLQDCPATIGRVGNVLHDKTMLGKAGRSRWLGRRPKVRGMAMNAVDHPHGGGRGKSKGNKHPRSPWGWLTKGKRTRRPGPKGPKNSNKMVVKERPRGVERLEGQRV